ncbi:MAG TPA: methyltransferase domain-containing protein [Candidatus Paceibacterota bacterium]|nr:methyltransferase domain-containing protein [Candidatus Paceibacterota bacterium]
MRIEEYLKETDFCDCKNPKILEKTKDITKNLSSNQQKAIAIFEWVRDNINYRVGLWQRKASETLGEKEGTCTNKTNLLVAMLRSINIPAGYGVLKTKGQEYFGPVVPPILKRKIGKKSSHIYSFVFLDNRWIKCDPSLDLELSLKTSYFNPQSELVVWDGENNALENLDPSHIISDSERLTDIDSIMRKNSRHGTGIVIKVANLYIKFLRQNEIKIKSPEQLQNLFKKWLKKNNFLYYIIFLFVSFYKDIFYFFTNKDVLDDSFWSNYMKVFDIIGMAIPYQDMVEEIIKELDIKYTDKILDAGSGTGTLSIEIKKKYPVEMIGVDNSETALKIHLSKDPEANLVKSDLTNLKFPDNEFDKLICMLTLHSIPYEFRARVLSEFYRVLKPGGKIVLSNPYSNFSPNRIFIEHIKKDLRKSGLIKVLKDSIKHFIPIIKMFYYNNLIKREEKKRDGVLLSFNEQKELLEKTGFNNVSDTRVLYSKSAIINSAYK